MKYAANYARPESPGTRMHLLQAVSSNTRLLSIDNLAIDSTTCLRIPYIIFGPRPRSLATTAALSKKPLWHFGLVRPT